MRFFILFLGVLWMTTVQAADFTIESNAFANGKTIPQLHTCKGKDISPQLAWSGAPEKTQSFALIVSDPDAPSGTWYHWILYNLPSSTSALVENVSVLPSGAVAGKTSFAKEQYNGPCPPPGAPHHYIFTLYALDTKLTLAKVPDAEELIQAMTGHVLGSVTLVGMFG